MDVAAFDKSQGHMHLEFFLTMMRKLGMQEKHINFWRRGQVKTTSTTRSGSMSFQKYYQTNSGDASTILKNTISLMHVLMYVAKDKYAIFKGDDSLIFDAILTKLQLEDMMRVHNFEVKIIDSDHIGYYAGNFVYFREHWRIMRDFIKLADTAHRGIIKTQALENYVSLVDAMKLIDVNDADRVERMAIKRFGLNFTNYYFFLKTLISSFTNYIKHHKIPIGMFKKQIRSGELVFNRVDEKYHWSGLDSLLGYVGRKYHHSQAIIDTWSKKVVGAY